MIKNGTIIETIHLSNLKNETFLSIGRFPLSDIQLDHPSVSRYHCILQYGELISKSGWYLYDLDTTHGTRLNKQNIKSRVYAPISPGYFFYVAGIYIFYY